MLATDSVIFLSLFRCVKAKAWIEEGFVRGKLTRKIKIIYAEAVFTRLNRYAKKSPNVLLSRMTKVTEAKFRKAAHDCARVGADPLEWVGAQFDAFDAAGAFMRKILLPRPSHLAGLKAEQRWRIRNEGKRTMQSEGEAIARDRRSRPGGEGPIDVEKQVRESFRDERKLENLSRVLGVSPLEVLRRFPKEFSSEFAAQSV